MAFPRSKLTIVIPLFIVVFSWIYLTMSQEDHAVFGAPLSRTAALVLHRHAWFFVELVGWLVLAWWRLVGSDGGGGWWGVLTTPSPHGFRQFWGTSHRLGGVPPQHVRGQRSRADAS